MANCEVCKKGEEYHSCERCGKRLCIGAPRAGKSMVYNKCLFCGAIYATDAKREVCDKCEIILTWKSSMNYLAAVNRVSTLLEKGQLDPKLRNESYCKASFGLHAAQVIMDAIDSSKF